MLFLTGFTFILSLVQVPVGESVDDKRFLFATQTAKPPLAIQQPTYKAAVYNHEVVSPGYVTSRAEALAAMNKNLDIYEKQAAQAGSQVHQLRIHIITSRVTST